MKTCNLLAIGIAVVVLGPGTGATVRADDDDHRIEAAAKNSYVFRTYLKDDDITPPRWPCRIAICLPPMLSQTRTVLSRDDVTIRIRSGLMLADVT